MTGGGGKKWKFDDFGGGKWKFDDFGGGAKSERLMTLGGGGGEVEV